MPNVVRKVDAKTKQEIQAIIDSVCEGLALSSKCVMGRFGKWECSDARFILVKLIKDRFDVTDRYIGLLFKRKTQMFAFQSELKCKELLKHNSKFREKYYMAIDSINGKG